MFIILVFQLKRTTMKTYSILIAVCLLVTFSSCKKKIEAIKEQIHGATSTTTFVDHYIAKGQNNSNKNGYKSITLSQMNFIAKFDNSAMYQTVIANNQLDINKLYGFSDNNQDHHTNSARIGWRWYNNELQLFAYVYNNAVESDKFITSVPLNQEIPCSIKVDGANYILTANGVQVTMPRASTTEQAVGYQLYPYFGGDEVAPQDIHIFIKEQ
jgi:hypothetical protein